MIEVKPYIDKFIKENTYYHVEKTHGVIEKRKYISPPDIRETKEIKNLENLERFFYDGEECIKYNGDYYYASARVLDEIFKGKK